MTLVVKELYCSVNHGGSKTEKTSIGPVKQIFQASKAIISLPSNLNKCFGCSKEPSH